MHLDEHHELGLLAETGVGVGEPTMPRLSLRGEAWALRERFGNGAENALLVRASAKN